MDVSTAARPARQVRSNAVRQSDPRLVRHNERHRNIEELDRAIVRLSVDMNAAEYQFLCLVREFDERAGWLKWGLSSCSEWLHWRCDIALATAREKVRVAHALKPLPEMSAAFEKGDLAYSKVRAMTRVATPDNEHGLIGYAQDHTTHRVQERCLQMRNVQDGSIDEAMRLQNARSLKCFRDTDRQTLRITVELPVETGELVMAALDKAMSDRRIGSDICDDSARLAAGEEGGSLVQAQADALVNVMRAYVSNNGLSRTVSHGLADESTSEVSKDEDIGDLPNRAALYNVVLHVDEAALSRRGGSVHGGTNPENASRDASHKASFQRAPRSDLPIETMRRVCCDASITPMIDNMKGQPLSVGRKTRVVSAAIQRALWSRDKGCRFPGCSHSRFVEAHHVVHWAHGGETAIDNLILLCSRHHTAVHEGGYRIQKTPDDEFFFVRPDGRAVPALGYRREDVVDEPAMGVEEPRTAKYRSSIENHTARHVTRRCESPHRRELLRARRLSTTVIDLPKRRSVCSRHSSVTKGRVNRIEQTEERAPQSAGFNPVFLVWR